MSSHCAHLFDCRLEPRDSLRYLHFTGVAMGTWRLAEERRIADALDALAAEHKRASVAAAAAGSAAVAAAKESYDAKRAAVARSFNAEQLSNCLDRWSINQLVNALE